MGGAGACGPVHSRQHPRQGAGKTLHAVGHHRQTEFGKPVRRTVCVQDQHIHLRFEPGDNMGQKRPTAQVEQPLVAAAHAPGLPPGKDHPGEPHSRPLPLRA